jgi:hypothetical protein
VTDRLDESRLGARLLAEDERRHGASGAAPTRDAQALLEVLIDHELATERRLRTSALWAWIAVVAFVCLTGFMRYLSHIDREVIAEAAHPAVFVMMTLAIIALFLALLMTTVWLLRTRSMSLAIIERRLASLESSLRRDG